MPNAEPIVVTGTLPSPAVRPVCAIDYSPWNVGGNSAAIFFRAVDGITGIGERPLKRPALVWDRHSFSTDCKGNRRRSPVPCPDPSILRDLRVLRGLDSTTKDTKFTKRIV